MGNWLEPRSREEMTNICNVLKSAASPKHAFDSAPPALSRSVLSPPIFQLKRLSLPGTHLPSTPEISQSRRPSTCLRLHPTTRPTRVPSNRVSLDIKLIRFSRESQVGAKHRGLDLPTYSCAGPTDLGSRSEGAGTSRPYLMRTRGLGVKPRIDLDRAHVLAGRPEDGETVRKARRASQAGRSQPHDLCDRWGLGPPRANSLVAEAKLCGYLARPAGVRAASDQPGNSCCTTRGLEGHRPYRRLAMRGGGGPPTEVHASQLLKLLEPLGND